MTDKNNNINQPQPFEKGFGVQPVHDKPSSSESNDNKGRSNNANDNKK